MSCLGYLFVVPNYRKLYACVCGGWTWRTKSIGFWDVLGMSCEWGVRDGWTACGTWTVYSPEVLLLGWMSDGVHFMLNLGMLWAREFIVRKAGMRVQVRARSSDERAWESVKQDYERDRLVGWTTSEEGRGSTWNPRFRVHAWTHVGYECGKMRIFFYK